MDRTTANEQSSQCRTTRALTDRMFDRQIAVGFQRHGVPLQGLLVDERSHSDVGRLSVGEQGIRVVADSSRGRRHQIPERTGAVRPIAGRVQAVTLW